MGLLDEDFFFSHEDLEYSLRLTRAGYWLAVAGDAFVYHAGGKSRETLAEGKSDELIFAAARVLYRKLEAIYGAGKIPTSTELWGSDLYCFDPEGNLKPQYQKGAKQGLTIG
jgi:GT2 family glycosyltransferase